MKDINKKMALTALVLGVLAVLSVIFAIGFGTKEKMENKAEEDNIVEETAFVNTKSDLIVLDSPLPNQTVKSPIKISGKARGTWYFEASFPVSVVDWDGKIIGTGVAQAQEDWMTEDFVPFVAEITFTLDPNIYSKKGTLILQKDNPSGEPENDDALEVPIIFE